MPSAGTSNANTNGAGSIGVLKDQIPQPAAQSHIPQVTSPVSPALQRNCGMNLLPQGLNAGDAPIPDVSQCLATPGQAMGLNSWMQAWGANIGTSAAPPALGSWENPMAMGRMTPPMNTGAAAQAAVFQAAMLPQLQQVMGTVSNSGNMGLTGTGSGVSGISGNSSGTGLLGRNARSQDSGIF